MNRPRLVVDNSPDDEPWPEMPWRNLSLELHRALGDYIAAYEAHTEATKEVRRTWARIVEIKHRIWAQEARDEQ